MHVTPLRHIRKHHGLLFRLLHVICTALKVSKYFWASRESSPSRLWVDEGGCTLTSQLDRDAGVETIKSSSTHSLQQDPILAGLLLFTSKLLGTVREGIIVKHIADFDSALFLFGISTEHGVREHFVWVLEAEYPRDSALQRDGLV